MNFGKRRAAARRLSFSFLVQIQNILSGSHRKPDQLIPVEFLFMHIHCRYPTVFIGGIVIDTPGGIAAGRVLGDFTAVILQTATSPGLAYRSENMKELIDTIRIFA